MAGKHWAESVRFHKRTVRLFVIGLVAAISIVAIMQISMSAVSAASGTGNTTYVVARGDTLSRIAKKYKTSVSVLVQLNKIKNANQIREGVRITVPGTASAPAKGVAAPSISAGKIPTNLQSHSDRMAYQAYFNKWADANGISRDLLKSVCYLESGWNNSAVSSTGARGIGQLLPSTAQFIKTSLIGQPQLSTDKPEDNIRMSARYIAYLLKLSHGDEQMAVASYYQGFNSIQRDGIHSDAVAYVHTVFAFRPSFS